MANDIFETKLLDTWPQSRWKRYRLLLAVSGGADSAALLCAFARTAERKNLLALHVNHQLRGEESEEDARFTARLAEKYDVPFREERIAPDELRASAAREGGVEAGARAVRYRLLLKNAEAVGARFVLTAHHADDQIETVLCRLFRGSGIEGLAGMSPFRPLSEAVVLARPFLSFTRAEMTGYLTRLGESWRTDSSNLSREFLRNRIRHELLPLLRELFPGKAEGSVLKLAGQAADLKDFLDSLIRRSLPDDGNEALFCRDGSVIVPMEALAGIDPFLLPVLFRRLWRRCAWPMGEMDAARWNALAQMVRGEGPSRRFLPGGLTAERRGRELVIRPAKEDV